MRVLQHFTLPCFGRGGFTVACSRMSWECWTRSVARIRWTSMAGISRGKGDAEVVVVIDPHADGVSGPVSAISDGLDAKGRFRRDD